MLYFDWIYRNSNCLRAQRRWIVFLKRSHHHHISVMELGHLLTRSGLMYPEVSSKVCHDCFCQLGNSVSLPWVIYYGAFYSHIVSSFSFIPVICLKLVLFLIPLQFVQFENKRLYLLSTQRICSFIWSKKQTTVFSYTDVPWLRQLVVHLSPWGFGFDPMSVHVRFMV